MTADYSTLLEMWRDEKKKREKAEEDNKKLSKQISDYIKNHEDKFRKAGM